MKQLQVFMMGGLLLWALTTHAEPMDLERVSDFEREISAQKSNYLKLDCQGRKATKWRMKMNMKTNKIWVKLKRARPYSLPITYSQWDANSRKRILIIAGKNKEYIKATINRTHTCRLAFSKLRYAYSINAKVARIGHLSGCCSDTGLSTSR